MQLIELSNYTLASAGTGNGLNGFYFALLKGDICSIYADSEDDAHIFLKAIATLIRPTKGTYRFMGEKIDFSDHRNLLSCKKKIGYISSDSAMISNKTVRENLLFMRYYFENSLSITLDENVSRLCGIFNIQDKLDMHPAEISLMDLRIAIIIRELTKSPDLLLIEYPEELISHAKFDFFIKILKDALLSGPAVIFISNNKSFVEEFSDRNILITNGTLTTI